MSAKTIGYWVATGVGTALLTFGGISEVMHSQRIVETIAHLGFPAFLPSLLGTWKLLAVAAVLTPGFRRLKEWAYAGVLFDTTGAIASHMAVHDGAPQIAPPLMALALFVTSWALRPASRKLSASRAVPSLFPPRRLVTVAGQSIAVPQPGKLVHLQLRRFAGCPICNLHLRSVVKRHGELVAAGVTEVVVFHSTPEELKKYQAELPFPVVADAKKELYAELDVGTSLGAVLDPRAWPAIVRGLIRTARDEKLPLGAHEGGSLGLPGDFLIDSTGRIVASKVGEHSYDQWSVDEVLTLARAERQRVGTESVLRAARAA